MDKDVSPIIDKKYYMNQTDDAFKEITLGTSSKKVTTHGCYVCSIAVIICWYLEDSSDETKKAVVETLAKNCTSNGDYKNTPVKYDGRTFKMNTNIPDMSQKLLDGYPSICELDGHFVVINGYDKDKEGWERYLVLDVGYRSHTNLKEPMDIYGETIESKRFVYEDK